MNNTILIAAIAVAFVAGTLTTATLVEAVPPRSHEFCALTNGITGVCLLEVPLFSFT